MTLLDPASPSRVRDALREVGTNANRLLGQNFLVNAGVLDKIVAAADIAPDDCVLEIGPGLGALTVRLLPIAGTLVAIEKDFKLAAYLSARLVTPNFRLVRGDALDVDYETLDLPETGLKIVANLPFSISKPMLRRILEEWRPHLHSATFVVQREVANRLVASPGTSEYGPMSLSAQLYGRARKLFDISAGSFFPPPEITSTVVRVELLRKPSLMLRDERFFWTVVRAAFSQRRKTLSNTLKPIAPREQLDAAFSHAAIDPQRRGETLSLQEFATLSDALLESR